MTPPPPLSPDLLLAHASSLRALARSLLRDAHAAEDALQETFALALERPPASLERLGAWLRVVLESVARKRMRGELRRARRERDSAREDCQPGVDEGVARSEVLRAVLDAVLALDEPYREVVLDRYFEGRSPREIARRRELSIHTVTSRLGRARGRLRERLARELGAGDERWRRTLAGVFGLALPAPRCAPIAIGLLPGALALSLKTKLVAVVTLAALAGFGWFTRGTDAVEPDATPAEVGALAPTPGADRLVPRSTGAVPDEGTRELVAPSAATADERRALPPYRFPLLVVARDAEDRPLANATVEVAPPAGPWNVAGVTDARGQLSLELRGHRPTLALAVRARRPFGGQATARVVDLQADSPTGVAFSVAGGAVTRLVFSVDGNLELQGSGATSAFLLDAAPRTKLELGAYPDGSRAFSARPLTAPTPPSELEGPLSFEFEEPIAGAFTINLLESDNRLGPPPAAIEDELQEPSAARASGQLVNGDGNPLAGVRVEARDAAGALLAETRTDDEGGYELELESSADVTLRAGGGERGIAESSWNPGVEPALRWNPLLDRGHELLGRLVDAAGEPLAGWSVEVRLDEADQPWWDATRTAEDGRFAIPNLPRRPLQLALRPGDASNALAAVQLDDVWPGYDERRFELDPDALRAGAVRVQVLGGDGAPLEGCELRLWQRRGGFGTTLDAAEPGGSYAARGIPAGEYRIEVGSREHGFVEAASFQIAPGEELDLGLVSLEPPATLALSLPELDPATPTAFELWSLRSDHEACVVRDGRLPSEELRLAPGPYELVATSGDRRVVRALTLAAGERKELALDELGASARERR